MNTTLCATTSAKACLEIVLVLSSLFFISRKKMFPVLGVIAGLTGTVLAATGLLP
jgi:hypothetical protein